jgi:hypothetical protein
MIIQTTTMSTQTDILKNPGCRYYRGPVVGLDHPGFFVSEREEVTMAKEIGTEKKLKGATVTKFRFYPKDSPCRLGEDLIDDIGLEGAPVIPLREPSKGGDPHDPRPSSKDPEKGKTEEGSEVH